MCGGHLNGTLFAASDLLFSMMARTSSSPPPLILIPSTSPRFCVLHMLDTLPRWQILLGLAHAGSWMPAKASDGIPVVSPSLRRPSTRGDALKDPAGSIASKAAAIRVPAVARDNLGLQTMMLCP
jgi:hypothetical protein